MPRFWQLRTGSADAESGGASGYGASGAAGAPQKSALIREHENRTPGKWLEKITELRRDGKTAEADEMLAEFGFRSIRCRRRCGDQMGDENINLS